MRKLILIFAMALTSLVSYGQAATKLDANSQKSTAQRYLETILKEKDLAASNVGVLAVTYSGDTLVNYSSGKKLVPASNTKLLSTGAALRQLGSNYKFETKIGYTGTIEDGVLKGDLYIIGGGDPTIASKDSIAIATNKLFEQWRAFLTKAGIKKIEGNIVGDGRYFDGPKEVSTWQYEDIGTYYGTGGDGLCFYRNIKEFATSAGAREGDAVSMKPGYPDTPWMKYTYSCKTGRRGVGDQLYLYTTDLAPIADVRGLFGVDRKPKTVQCSNKYGAYTCAYYFRNHLVAKGIAVSGSAADIYAGKYVRTEIGSNEGLKAAPKQSKLQILGSTFSPALSRIAFITNQRSDNFYAEACLRALGREMTGSASYDSSLVAQKRVFKSMGLDISSQVSLADGSGLSRNNWVSPAFFCDFLRTMLKSKSAASFIESLPKPGEGTQVGRMRNEEASVRERVHFKSGSMDGVRCYSGYIESTDGAKDDTIIFSIMINSFSGSNWKVMGQIDKLIALMANENK